MSDHSVAVATTIANQLGGTRVLKMMIGASNFFSMPDDVAEFGGLQFSIPSNLSRPRISKVMIKLNANDLYDVELGLVRRSKGVLGYKVVSTHTDVHCDALRSVLERSTGLCLGLPLIDNVARSALHPK